MKKTKKKALVLAGGLPQITLIKELQKRGYYTILADGSDQAIAKPYADQFYRVNIFDLAAVKAIAVDEKVDFLLTVCADQVLWVVAKVSEELGLPCYIDNQTAILVSDKEEMKHRFREFTIPTSNYEVMHDLDVTLLADLHYPLVVKPVDAYSSKGVVKIQNNNELQEAFREAVQISRTKNAIIEEYKPGEEISVDAFITEGKAHVLCISNSEKIKDANRFVIFRGRYPANLGSRLKGKIEEVCQNIADAFGLRNTPMLVQMITDGENLSVLEFSARTGGAMKFLLIRRVCGFDVISATVDLTVGRIPEVNLREPEGNYIVNDFIYCEEGVFDRLAGFENLLAQGVLTDYHLLRTPGTFMTGKTNSSSDRIAGVTIVADSVEEFNAKHSLFVAQAKVLDTNGRDIMRHELLPPLTQLRRMPG